MNMTTVSNCALRLLYEGIHFTFHIGVAAMAGITEVLLIGAKTMDYVIETAFGVVHYLLFGILGYD